MELEKVTIDLDTQRSKKRELDFFTTYSVSETDSSRVRIGNDKNLFIHTNTANRFSISHRPIVYLLRVPTWVRPIWSRLKDWCVHSRDSRSTPSKCENAKNLSHFTWHRNIGVIWLMQQIRFWRGGAERIF